MLAEIMTARAVIDKRKAEKRVLLQQVEAENQKLEKIKAELTTLEMVTILLQKTSDYARNAVKSRIEEIVTQALLVITGQPCRFTIDIVERAGRVECDYYLQDSGTTIKLEKPDYNHGGGYVDIITLALRLAIGELKGVKGTLLLDEVGKHISAEYAPNVAYFLSEYSKAFGRQIVLITHNEALKQAGDLAYRVRKVNDESEVCQV